VVSSVVATGAHGLTVYLRRHLCELGCTAQNGETAVRSSESKPEASVAKIGSAGRDMPASAVRQRIKDSTVAEGSTARNAGGRFVGSG